MTNQTTKPYYPTRSVRIYQRKYPNACVTLELKEKNLNLLPASKWGKEHLIACRLIHKKCGRILPILKEFAPELNDLKDRKEWDNIKRLIDGLRKKDLLYESSLELERDSGDLGMLWSALAKCMAPNELVEARIRPQRERRKTQSKGYVSSEYIQTSSNDTEEAASESGSSSHQSSQHSSQRSYRTGSSCSGEIDNDEHTDRTKSEVLTVNLAVTFIRYVLNVCAGQDPEKQTLLEFRQDPVREHHDLPLLRVDATDDGGIWRVETKEKGKGRWIWRNRLALLEAKKAFQGIDNNGQPVVSDANLAQYTCEALTACLNDPDQDEVFVIVITQTFMRFLNFHRTKDYIEYLKCTNVDKQRASNEYLHMTETDFFALDSKAGRRDAVRNLLGLVKFWEKQGEIADSEEIEDREEIEDSEEIEYSEETEDSDNLVGNEGDSEMNADNHNNEDSSPKVRKRKRYSS